MLSDYLDDSKTLGSEFRDIITMTMMANTYFTTYLDVTSFHLCWIPVLLCFAYMASL